jgi:hypothetical protein
MGKGGSKKKPPHPTDDEEQGRGETAGRKYPDLII